MEARSFELSLAPFVRLNQFPYRGGRSAAVNLTVNLKTAKTIGVSVTLSGDARLGIVAAQRK
jgi:hypothetical protein